MKSNLFKKGFLALNTSLFFGAANDNVLKGVLIFMVGMNGIWANRFGGAGAGLIGLGSTLPFILFSGYAGQLSDKYSKRDVVIITKIAEVPIAILAGVGLLIGSLWLSIVALVLISAQSAYFGPAKFGLIPELVEERDLSRANGAINMVTNVAIIIGLLVAGPISTEFDPSASESLAGERPTLWLPLAVMFAIAAVGLVASFQLPRLEAKNPHLRYNLNPIGDYWRSIKEMSKGPLLVVALSWAMFYLIGMAALLVLPAYEGLLDISYTEASVLLAVLAVSSGIGSGLSGLVSGHHIEPRLVIIGAVGLTFFLFLLGLVTPTYLNTAVLVGFTGLFAGAYLVPLQALIQDLAPEDERGRFLGTTNALMFIFSSIGGLVVTIARGVFELAPNHILLVCAAISLAGTIVLILYVRPIMFEAADRLNEARTPGDPARESDFDAAR